MITFIAHMRVNAENTAAFEAAMTEMCAQVTAHEPGVAYYAFSKSAADPETYLVIEVYRDAAACAAHTQTDWFKSSVPKTAGLMMGAPEIRQYVSEGSVALPL